MTGEPSSRVNADLAYTYGGIREGRPLCWGLVNPFTETDPRSAVLDHTLPLDPEWVMSTECNCYMCNPLLS